MTHRPADIVRTVRPMFLFVAVSLALVVGTQAALGAEAVNTSGKRGTWTLRDTMSRPAVTCTYGIDGNALDGQLDRIEARSPRAFARDRRAGRLDGQWVGIRILFQKSKADGGAGGWQTVKSTGWIKKYAYEDKAVNIGNRTWRASYDGMPQFRVRANIRWYKPGTRSVVQGAATLAYEWYGGGGGSGTTEAYPTKCLPE